MLSPRKNSAVHGRHPKIRYYSCDRGRGGSLSRGCWPRHGDSPSCRRACHVWVVEYPVPSAKRPLLAIGTKIPPMGDCQMGYDAGRQAGHTRAEQPVDFQCSVTRDRAPTPRPHGCNRCGKRHGRNGRSVIDRAACRASYCYARCT